MIKLLLIARNILITVISVDYIMYNNINCTGKDKLFYLCYRNININMNNKKLHYVLSIRCTNCSIPCV